MKKSIRILVPLLLAALIIASIGWYLFVYDRDFTRDVLLSQARFHNTQGNTKLASWFYDLAYEHTGQDANVAIELANQYKNVGNYTKAEFTLTNAIADSGGTAELYTALSKTYVEQDKLLDAVTMLDGITDPLLKSQLDALRPSIVSVDPAPGFYNTYERVTLNSSGGITYYNTTGDYPSRSDPIYTKPIALQAGVTTITAVCVADSGLVSPLSTYEYTVGGVIELVTFEDPAVEASIRQILNVSANQEIYTNELWEITDFTVPAEANTYGDLSLLTHLQTLTLREKELDNLDFLSGLTELTSLDLTGCRFPGRELSKIAALPKLHRLTLAKCGLSTIANLEGAPQISYLNLNNNTLRNLEVLSSMTGLTELHLSHNALVELTQIGGLTNLTKLDVSFNALTTLDPIAACVSLTWLDASNNTLNELTAVDKLTGLTYLALEHNGLTDVSIIANCVELLELSLSNNSVSDISALDTLTKLEIFDFSYNQVNTLPKWGEGCALRTIDGSYNELDSIDSLAKMENLTYVYMDYNKLTKVDALASCYHLVQVNVYGNAIKDVSALLKTADGEDKGIIVNYDPTVD